MTIKQIPIAKAIFLSDKENGELNSVPFLNVTFEKNEKQEKEWTIEIMCYLRLNEGEKEVLSLWFDDSIEMQDNLLPVKKLHLNMEGGFRENNYNLWYVKAGPFTLEKIYNILEVEVDDDLFTGKKRGGRTVGIYTPLSNENL